MVLASDHGALGEAIGTLREQPASELDLAAPAALQRRRMQLIRRELEVGRQCIDLDQRHRAVLDDVREATIQAVAAAEKGVRKKLVSIGYHDVAPTSPEHGKITPDMIHRHPDVRAAKDRHGEITRRQGHVSTQQHNEECLRTLHADLERYRDVGRRVITFVE